MIYWANRRKERWLNSKIYEMILEKGETTIDERLFPFRSNLSLDATPVDYVVPNHAWFSNANFRQFRIFELLTIFF